MREYSIILKALFKNKFRFADDASPRKKYGFTALILICYAAVMAILISGLLGFKLYADIPSVKLTLYIFGLFTAALVVLIFGIVNLVSTLYLSKDTDFYSMLPVKSSVVFAAKVSYVYISEAVIVGAILLPLMITFGIISQAWAWFYVISLLAIVLVPCLPLVLAAIIAIPVMYFASKLKNRSVVSLIFYIVLFGAFFGVYIYFIYSATNITEFDENMLEEITNSISSLLYVFYPFTALAMAACEIPAYNLSVGASAAANIAIFVGASLAMLVIALLLAKFMYSQSAKANNQTNNSDAKHGEYKSSGMTKALMKREFVGAMRTTQVAFQCYAVAILPTILAIVFGILSMNIGKLSDAADEVADAAAVIELTKQVFALCGTSTLAAMFATLGNAAATTFSREGIAVASLKTLPCSAKQILKAKVYAWLCVALPAAIVAVTVLAAFNFDLVTFLLSLFSLVPLAAAYVLFGALWDLAAPKLKWVDPLQAIKHNGHVLIGQFISMAGGFISLIVVIAALNMNNVDMDVIKAIYWSIIYGTLAVFVVVDIVLMRKVEHYYNRIEI